MRSKKPLDVIRNAADANRVLAEAGYADGVVYERTTRAYYFQGPETHRWRCETLVAPVISGWTPAQLLAAYRYQLERADLNHDQFDPSVYKHTLKLGRPT